MIKNNKRKRSGFTLIELIAVLVILGILAGFAIPKYADMREDAERASLDGVGAAFLSQCSIEYGRLAMGAVDDGSGGTLELTADNIASQAIDNISYDTDKYSLPTAATVSGNSITIEISSATTSSIKKEYEWTMP